MQNAPIILTLDAGGTNFIFSARKNGEPFGEAFRLPSNSNDLELCLKSIKSGFQTLKSSLPEKIHAISFAFPGPADYKNGIIGDLPNLKAFRGGVALGPMLEDMFEVPVFINNDGDLFALGESKAGFLPYVNELLEDSGNQNRYKNLIGITLGTGFGVGISINGNLLEGDNSAASEGWLLRNKQYNYTNVEDTIGIRAIKRMYAEQIFIDPEGAPEPSEIYEIAMGKKEGIREAAIETYLRFGDALGDAIAHIVTLVDGLVVIGGGISGAYPLFARSMFDELNGFFTTLNGTKQKRLIQQVFNLEDDYQRKLFITDSTVEIEIPDSNKKTIFQKEKKIVVGLSKLGASNAISLGAYYFALEKLDKD